MRVRKVKEGIRYAYTSLYYPGFPRWRYVTFQLAEVAIPRDLFADILERIDRLRPAQAPT